MDLKEQARGVNPDVHWYYQVKKIPFMRFFYRVNKNYGTNVVIDVGSGSGIFSKWLQEKYPNRISKVYQVDIAYTDREINESQGEVIEKCRYVPNNFENALIVMMDVLEHIEDDIGILEEIRSKAKGSNNYFFITVPAFNSLWSPHDEFLGHFRRYRIPLLTNRLKNIGYQVSRSYYMYGLIFPLVWLYRKINKRSKADSDMKPLNPALNTVLKAVNVLELPFRKINKSFGVTCVAEGKVLRND